MDTIVSKDMTSRDTQDMLMGKMIDLQEISDENHRLVMKSLESVAEILTHLNQRVTELEAQVNG